MSPGGAVGVAKSALRGWRVPIALGTFVAVSFLSAQVFGEHGYLRLQKTKHDIAQLEQEVKQLDAEKQRLENRVRKLKTDPGTIEAIAREDLRLVKPGEVIYTVPNQPPSTEAPPAPKK